MRALLSLALLAVPAAVQAEPDRTLANKEMRIAVRKFADCIIRRRHDEAADVILTDQTNVEIVRRHQRLVNGECLVEPGGGGLEARFPGDTLRYALAEALVRKDYATGFPPGIPLAAPLAQREADLDSYAPPPGKTLKPKQLAAFEKRKNDNLAFAFLTRFGECVVRADPTAAHRLLLTAPLSDEEATAFKALAPKLSGCLEEKAQIKANKATIRGTIAHNFYRLAKAPRLPAPGVTH